jgi:transcriptional regulator with XRE-family HTH domain
MPAPDDALLSQSAVLRLPFDDRPALRTCGAVVRQHRLAQGLTQHSLASRLGLTRDAISALELGRCWLSARHLLHLAHILGIDAWQLFPPPPTAPGAALLRLLPFVPHEIQAALVELVRPRPGLPSTL